MKQVSNSLKVRPRVLIVKLSSLGDLFHALPAVHLIKKHLQAEVDWVTQPEYVPLVRCFTEVNHVISFPRRNMLRGLPTYLREVRRERYDYILDMQGLLKSALAAHLADGEVRIGPSYQREGARLFYHHVAGVRDKNRHAVEEALDVARFLNIPVDEIAFPVVFPEVPLEGAAPRVALIPCSRWVTKNPPSTLFSGVGRLLLERGVQSVFLVGAPDDASVCERLAAEISCPGVFNLCGKTTLPELGGILSRMDLVITVDSGPMHLAAAGGTRVAAVFGATDPLRTGPYGDGHILITEEGLACRPCLSRTCRRGDLACLNRLTPEQVLERIEQAGVLLKRHTGDHSS
ncbi:MAG: glycosyltransferase family 9 protein [Kiritimatiellae bacterium]|nr:glycosyltransferase family 9 protein [Kiritimatiellia bacterium]